jgi:hypothetical protein
METLTKEVVEIKTEATNLERMAVALEINDPASQQEGTNLLAAIAKASKAIEAQRKFFVDPLNHQVKAINAKFKEIAGPLDNADGILRGKVKCFYEAQEKAKREEEARRQAAYDKERTEARAFGEAAPAPAQDLQLPDVDRTIRAQGGTASIAMKWTFEVTDVSQVPTQYLAVNGLAVREAIRNGARVIPGLRIYEEPNVRVRS